MAILPPPRHKAKHSYNVLLMLVLIVLIGAFVAYMLSPNADKSHDDKDKIADKPIVDDKQMKACEAQGHTTGTCAADGDTVRLKCSDKRYGADCAKTCHGGDGHSFAEYTPGFDGGPNAATCKCPEKFHFKNTDIARGGCLSGGECADGYAGKDCSSSLKDAKFEGWTEVSSKSNFVLDNDGQTPNDGGNCGAEESTNPIALCKAFTMSSDPGKPCLTAKEICSNNLVKFSPHDDRTLCNIMRDCSGGSDIHSNISKIEYPQGTSLRLWANDDACTGDIAKDFAVCRGASCTSTDNTHFEHASFTFGLAPGHFLKCDDKVFFGADTSSAKMPKNMKNAYRVDSSWEAIPQHSR